MALNPVIVSLCTGLHHIMHPSSQGNIDRLKSNVPCLSVIEYTVRQLRHLISGLRPSVVLALLRLRRIFEQLAVVVVVVVVGVGGNYRRIIVVR